MKLEGQRLLGDFVPTWLLKSLIEFGFVCCPNWEYQTLAMWSFPLEFCTSSLSRTHLCLVLKRPRGNTFEWLYCWTKTEGFLWERLWLDVFCWARCSVIVHVLSRTKQLQRLSLEHVLSFLKAFTDIRMVDVEVVISGFIKNLPVKFFYLKKESGDHACLYHLYLFP